MNGDLVVMEREQRDGLLLVRLSGEIDLSNVDRLQQQLDLAIARSPVVAIDLDAVEYIDSQGLRVLKQLADRLGREGAKLQLIARPGGFTRRVLELTSISEEIEVLDAIADS